MITRVADSVASAAMMPSGLEAVHHRHADVHQHDVGPLAWRRARRPRRRCSLRPPPRCRTRPTGASRSRCAPAPGRRPPPPGSSFRLTVRQRRCHPVPTAGGGADGELAAPQLDSFAHAHAGRGPTTRRRRDHCAASPPARGRRRPPRRPTTPGWWRTVTSTRVVLPGVLDHVGQCLLHHPVGRELHAGVHLREWCRRRAAPRARRRRARRRPGAAGRRDRAPGADERAPSLSRSTPSRRRSLGQRAARRVGDGVERGASLLGSLVEHVRTDAGLHGDDRHRVGDHVVQFLGDAQPLFGDDARRMPAARLRLAPPVRARGRRPRARR